MIWERMREQFSVSKTLRFELEPIGATIENMKGVINKDEDLAEDYESIKKLIDEYHKDYISRSLARLEFAVGDFDKKKDMYRKIAECFDKEGRSFESFFKLAEKDTEENQKIFARFKGFRTYLSGFNSVRENIYSSQTDKDGNALHGSICFRIVDDNWSKFWGNCEACEKLKGSIEYERAMFEKLYFNKCLTQKGIDDYNEKIGKINKDVNEYNQHNKTKLPFLKLLFKQILFDREKAFISEFENDEQVARAVNEYIGDYNAMLGKPDNVFAYKGIEYKKIDTKFEVEDFKKDAAATRLKECLDGIKELWWAVSKIEKEDKDDVYFQGIFDRDGNVLRGIIPLYNKVRNYVTKKPYSDEKIKINFDHSNILGGWDVNKERDCLSVLLRKGGFYYLGIIDKNSRKLFENVPVARAGESVYEKMRYKQIAQTTGIGGFIRKCARVCEEKYGWVCPDGCRNKKGEIIIRDDEVNGNLPELIRCYKDFFARYEKDGYKYKEFGFKLGADNEYKSVNDFFEYIARQSYKVAFVNIPDEFVDRAVQEGRLYLFRIYSKDFSPNSNGMPNLHTLYFKSLFCDKNLEERVHRLCGGAEMFWRKGSIKKEDRVVHKKGQPIKSKKDDKRANVFDYDIVKDKRYTEDKFFLHLPIKINAMCDEHGRVNEGVKEIIKDNPDKVNVIGIDRGERHLLYMVLIDSKGEIKEQVSLNKLVQEYKERTFETDYRGLLDVREKEKQEARKEWKTIGNIKDLKHGYMSQVIPLIIEKAIKNDAVIVLENLNKGFKDSRKKVEKAVYQNFEKALIDKLDYYVKKERNPESVIGGLQLARKIDTFANIRGQSGILFYVNPQYTSAIDPTTGYIDEYKPKPYESIEKSREYIKKELKSFKYNSSDCDFEIVPAKGGFTVCARGEHIASVKEGGIWKSEKIEDLAKKFRDLFDGNNIEYVDGQCLKKQIIEQTDAPFFKSLLWFLKIAFGLRNTATGEETDYILSPVRNKDGKFFDTREEGKVANAKLPICGDANGAYNIALKGLMAIKQIQRGDKKYDVDREKWLGFVKTKMGEF